MVFECCVKVGKNWSYRGVCEDKDSRAAAQRMQYIHHKNVWAVRPECSQDKFFVYRLPRLTRNTMRGQLYQ